MWRREKLDEAVAVLKIIIPMLLVWFVQYCRNTIAHLIGVFI